jgi:hypothetical protein
MGERCHTSADLGDSTVVESPSASGPMTIA